MIRSQVVVLKVFYDDEVGKFSPDSWDWDSLLDEPITGQEVLACGPVVDHPRLGEEEE